MTICTECGHEFSAGEALCEDWKDPERSYGCPGCGTFFIRDMRPKLGPAIIGGLLGGGIATPAVFLLARGLRASDPTLILMPIVILISVLIAGALLARATQPSLRISPFRQTVNRALDPAGGS